MVTVKKSLLLGILCIVAISGCTQQTPTEKYSNDIISVEEYYVSSLKPYAGSVTTMEFLLQNNGEYPVEWVEINFFNIQGFEVEQLNCQGTEAIDNRCIFDVSNAYGPLEVGDVRKVSLLLRAPSKDKIKVPTSLRIDYYINYTYFGFRKANIPIIDGTTITRPISQFSQSTSTYGPIQMSFEPPIGGVRKEDGKTIYEYWGVEDRPFEVKLKFNHVGTSEVDTVAIEKGNITLDLKGIEKIEGLPCDFCSVEEEGCPGKKPGYLYSTRRIKIPSTLICNFQLAIPNPPPEIVATIWADFTYTYKFIRSETFEVQPFGK